MAGLVNSGASRHALAGLGDLTRLIGERRVVVMLDYDGTLTPIVSDPTKALLSERMRGTLRELAEVADTGIVSGRSLAKLLDFVQVDSLFYAGSHGFDIMMAAPDGAASAPAPASPLRHSVAVEFLPALEAARDALAAKLADVAGATIEDNVYSITVHYRNCPAAALPALEAAISDVAAECAGRLVVTSGKKVREFRPDLPWNKGAAVAWIIKANGFDDAFTIYVGDDTTDEDAFRLFAGPAAAAAPAARGVGVLVSDDAAQPTAATLRLGSVDEVHDFLTKIVAFVRDRDAADDSR